MALQKQTVEIAFHKGLDTKTDPFRLSIGNFVLLSNSIFDTLGRLTKRNGFAQIATLLQSASVLTTFNGNLTAIGQSLQAFSQGSNSWVNTGSIQPMQLAVLPLIRNSVNQSQADAAISSNGLICTVYTESDGSTTTHKYAVADSTTGQNVIAPAALSADATYGTPKVFLLGTYFVIVYINNPGAYNLKYRTINTVNLTVGAATTVSTSITPSATVCFDGIVFSGSLFLAWNGAASSGIKCAALTSTLSLSSIINPDVAHEATIMSVTADTTNSVIWLSYYDSGASLGYSLALSPSNLTVILAATQIIPSGSVANITSIADSGINTIYYEVTNAYGYDGAIPTNYVSKITCTSAGVVGSPSTVVRSVGLASKAFVLSGSSYFLAAYKSPYQPTYFLINATTSVQAAPIVVAKLAYQNGGGYLTAGLPSVTVSDTTAFVPYLFKDLIQAVNKNTNVPSGSQTAGIYSQTGINLASFNFTSSNFASVEVASSLQMTGGFMWQYDGYVPVEQNFFLFPDSVEVTTATGSGSLVAQDYFYQSTYEWCDNQGNIHRSAPSIPVKQTTTTASSTNTIKVPTYRLTYKVANKVKIVLYRWSTAQQTYYQVTSISVPTLNTLSADYVTITDTFSDATILGNNIIYTNGGVVENTNAPSANAMTLFDTRAWMIDAEDPNLLLYSKQVIEATPVEMSSELTLYVPPNSAARGATGPMRCLFEMDEKLIIFKSNSIFYINGIGPDNTGANSQYSDPIFVTSPVGCTNPNSIVLIPSGLIFQSANGWWILNRSLQCAYIGAPVEAYNSATTLSALAIPGTNRVIFTLSTGIQLMYDYFVEQWSTHKGIPGISSTIYQGLQTFMSAPVTVSPPTSAPYTIPSQVYQETPDQYLDGSIPVCMSFLTGWINMAGLQGFKRAYWMELLGSYISPHKLSIGISYDYDSSVVQVAGVSPDNYSAPWGGDTLYGDSTPWGGASTVEQWQINFQRQTCQSFQISLQEYFDPTIGVAAGGGLTLSSLELVVGLKKAFPRNIPASHRTG